MKTDYWSTFEWIRNGEGGGNKEGYDPGVFENFTELDKKKAKDLLISDYNNRRDFAAQGLAMLLKEESEYFLKNELSRDDINLYQRIHLSSLLTYATGDFSHAEFIIGLLTYSELRVRKSAADDLYLIKELIPNTIFDKISAAIIYESDPLQRYKLGRLIYEASGLVKFRDLDIDLKLAKTKEEIIALVRDIN